MAYGAEIAALVTSLAATGLSMAGQSAQADQQNKDVSNELLRQQQYKKNATQVYQNSLMQSTPQAAKQQIAQGQQDAMEAYQKTQAIPITASAGNVGAGPTSINTPDQTARAGILNAGAAGIKGYGNFSLQQWLKDLDAKNQLGVIGNRSANSASILPYELQGAQNPYAGISGALGAFGSIANSFGGLTNDNANGVNAGIARGNAAIDASGRLKPFGSAQLIGNF